MTGADAIDGPGPLVLIAPHGGRRDPSTPPPATGRLRVNDLHTAALTEELARRLRASALVNRRADRNVVDLNRIGEAHERAPEFLAALARLLRATIARHGRATVLVVHGWNVVEPAVDIGLGCAAGAVVPADGSAAVSPAFAASGVQALVEACAARGIKTTLGARYPARHRENLLQLFTTRHRDDPRPHVRAVAALASCVDAAQLELGIPLRWPGSWRDRLLDACVAAGPALAAMGGDGAAAAPGRGKSPTAAPSLRIQFTSPTLCGLAAIDGGGTRLLLFPPDGGLLVFTGDRVVGTAPALTLRRTAAGGVRVALRGPLLRFPETTPFLDLERGLAAADLVDADVAIELAPDAPDVPFGRVAGHALVAAKPHPVDGDGFVETTPMPDVWPRFRTALRLRDGGNVWLTTALAGTPTHGVVRRDGREAPVLGARVELARGDAPLARVALVVDVAGGDRLVLSAEAVHRLPVVRRGPAAPLRMEFAACRVDGGGSTPAGWCEVAGL